jgi:hypothetical protein
MKTRPAGRKVVVVSTTTRKNVPNSGHNRAGQSKRIGWQFLLQILWPVKL